MKICVAAFAVMTVTSAVTQIAAAQSASETPSSFAIVEGVAIDSLHRDFLRGAVVSVEGAESRAVTDSLGRYRLDNIPPGTRRIQVIHPLLDTVGVSLLTAPLNLSAGQHLRLTLSTPSVATLLSLKCTKADRDAGPVMILGTVSFAETSEPAVGARVSLEWIDYRIGNKKIEKIPRQHTASVGNDGRFKICGLPEDLTATLTGISGSDSTAALEVYIANGIGMIGLDLPAPTAVAGAAAPASLTSGRSVLTGRVVGPTGTPLERARVGLTTDTAYAITGADGKFELRGLRAGTRLVSVRRLGSEPAEIPVTLRASIPTDITVKLGTFVALLDTVKIVATFRDRALDRVGFNRRKAGPASGFFLSPEDIEKRHALDLASLLSMAPMLRQTTVEGRPVITGRPVAHLGTFSYTGGCVSWILDGILWHSGGVEEFINPSEVAAIEVYSKNFVPVQFRSFADCETVVIWTKSKIH